MRSTAGGGNIRRTSSAALCTFPDCGRYRHGSRLWCSGHRAQVARGAPLTPLRLMAPYGSKPKCSIEGCGRHRHARGLCPIHYGEWRTEQGRPIASPAASLRFHYNMTVEEYAALLAEQGGVCAICREACSSGKRLAVDHDHTTGKCRGLLCMRCNTAVGLMRDDADLLLAAVAYLKAR